MLRVRVNLTGDTVGPGLSTFYFDGTTQGLADDAAAAVATFWTAIAAYHPSYGTWSVDTQVAVLNAVNGQLTDTLTVAPASGTGSDGSAQLSAASQGLIRLRTASVLGGRRLAGRLFIPGATETYNDTGGVPTAGYKLALNNAATALINDAGNAWVVWSRVNGTVGVITAADTWSKWAVMRSRRD